MGVRKAKWLTGPIPPNTTTVSKWAAEAIAECGGRVWYRGSHIVEIWVLQLYVDAGIYLRRLDGYMAEDHATRIRELVERCYADPDLARLADVHERRTRDPHDSVVTDLLEAIFRKIHEETREQMKAVADHARFSTAFQFATTADSDSALTAATVIETSSAIALEAFFAEHNDRLVEAVRGWVPPDALARIQANQAASLAEWSTSDAMLGATAAGGEA